MKTRKSPRKKMKTSKPLTSRKAIGENNRKLFDSMRENNSKLIDTVRDIATGMEQRVGKGSTQIWENQQKLHKGLETSEEHLVLIRRVLNDALGGVTRVTTIEREVFGSEETEEVQTIDWNWYTMQMDYSDNTEKFMRGVVLPDEEIEVRIAKAKKLNKLKVLDGVLNYMVTKEEKKTRELVKDPEKLSAYVVEFLAGKMKLNKEEIDWDEEQAEAVHKMALQKLEVIDHRKRAEAEAKAEMEKAKEKLLQDGKEFAEVAGKAVKAIKDGDDEAAAEAFDEMQERVDVKEKEAAAPPDDDGIPEGATVFGG